MPGVSLAPDEKLEIARALDELGVDTIEAGFAAVSEGEMEAMRRIAREGFEAEIFSACRSLGKDIDVALDVGVDGVNIIIPTSDLHLLYKLRKSREEALEMLREAILYAKGQGLLVEVSTEDGSRADLKFLKKVVAEALKAGADRIALCDTVGALTPEASYRFFSEMVGEFPQVPFAAHCHDDLGLAVANSLAALRAGALEAHVCVNGLGERAGNASLEELAVALRVVYGAEIGIRTERLWETSRLVERLTGVAVQPNKAIVGVNAFTHESGIHTHAVLVRPSTYEFVDPTLVGAARQIVAGKHAGSHGLRRNLEEMGFSPTEEEFLRILGEVKTLGDRGRRVVDTTLLEIAERITGAEVERNVGVEEFIVVTGNRVTPTASVKLSIEGVEHHEASTGVGPVDATLTAVARALKPRERPRLEAYHVDAITGGTDAEVEVRLRDGDIVVSARGRSRDIVKASVEAYIEGLNLILIKRQGLQCFRNG